MNYNVVMPQLGLTMEEGSVVSWKKQVGDWVEKGEVLFTVETDKAEMEVESADSGYLNSIQVELGKKVRVGTVIATLGDQPGEVVSEGGASSPKVNSVAQAHPTPALESKSAAGEVSDSSAGSASVSPPATMPSEEFAASPRARRLAEELGIDISALRPGRGQRIVEEDVRRFQASREETPARAPAAETAATPSRASLTRQIVAQRMTESFHSAPHFYLGVEANATDLVKFRDQLRSSFQPLSGLKLTYTDLFLRALVLGLKEHPQVNAYWQKDRVQPRDSIAVGFAVQTPEGLMVPVIRKADELSLFDLACQRAALREKAKAGKLSLQEMEGGSATLSNLGNFGVDWFQAILNPPQSVILATGRICKRAIVVNDSLAVCPTLVLSLSVDHRVLDGVAGANFLGRIKELIENPFLMLL
jgi:pyruvate dehydrogenase E2 component (dihydrolipoamide acetyltransferase)